VLAWVPECRVADRPGRIRKVILTDVNKMVEGFIFIQDGAYTASRIFMDMLKN
jgi:hypothetical protein